MTPRLSILLGCVGLVVLGGGLNRVVAQERADADDVSPPGAEADPRWGPPGMEGGPPAGFPPGGPGGFGPPGGPSREITRLLPTHDLDRNGWLDQDERAAAREALPEPGSDGFGRGRRGPPGGGFGDRRGTPEAGIRLTAAEVEVYSERPLYDPSVIRTLFLEFDNEDWEEELEAFHDTDVDVPVALTVDGKTYPRVGVGFRGMSSYRMVGRGWKRSFNLVMDLADKRQTLTGYRNLNLLNCSGDPSFLRAMLTYDISRPYLAVPSSAFVRVVINGESWGLYVSVQQQDTTFFRERYGTRKGARWKVPGSPMGQGSLAFLGEDLEPYRRIYEIKSKEDLRSWVGLLVLCQTLTETPPERLETALAPVLDVDGALRFLALENVLVNSDGYWTRASDYTIYQHPDGVFHILPYDCNETLSAGHGPGGPGRGGRGRFPGFPGGPGASGPDRNRDGAPGGGPPGGGRPGDDPGRPPMGFPGGGFPPRGPGAGGGPGGGGPELDPLVVADREDRPLASRLLAVPALRTRYLQYVRQIADHCLDPAVLGPRIETYAALIEAEVRADTRKLESDEAFHTAVDPDAEGLLHFATERRAFLLNHPDVKRAAEAPNMIPEIGCLENNSSVD